MKERSLFIRSGVGDRGLDSGTPSSFLGLVRVSVRLILDKLLRVV
jgi:hypothetical protein